MHTFDVCEKDLELLGEGSSRRVYGLDPEWAIKKPINYGGIWQNANEIKVFKKYKNSTLPICPIDLERSTSQSIFMRRVQPLEDMQLSMFDGAVMDYVDDCHKKYISTEQKRNFIKEMIDSNYDPKVIEFVKKLARFKSEDIHYFFYDVCSFNCGMLNDQIVIIDYGYPDDDYRDEHFYTSTKEYERYFECTLTD